MDKEYLNVLKCVENRITKLETRSHEIELIKKLSEALKSSIDYSERLEERIKNLENRSNTFEVKFKEHITRTDVHGFR
jgi:uncharacterized coiled-coil protein SlyX